MTQASMPLPATGTEPTSVPPAILLANHLRALKLPTFVREHEKVALEAAQDQADYPRLSAAATQLLQRLACWQMRLLDDPDDFELLGCGIPHSPSSPSAIMFF